MGVAQPREGKGLWGLYKESLQESWRGTTRAGSDRGDDFKWKEDSFRLCIRKTLFTMKVVRHCNRLSREVVEASSLEEFKAELDRALSNLV